MESSIRGLLAKEDTQMDLIDTIEEILKRNGIGFEYIWDENLDDGGHYLQCNVFKLEKAR